MAAAAPVTLNDADEEFSFDQYNEVLDNPRPKQQPHVNGKQAKNTS
jgi:hypothetical protein